MLSQMTIFIVAKVKEGIFFFDNINLSLMRVKKDVEKIRHRLEQKEYEAILDLIVEQDSGVLAAY